MDDIFYHIRLLYRLSKIIFLKCCASCFAHRRTSVNLNTINIVIIDFGTIIPVAKKKKIRTTFVSMGTASKKAGNSVPLVSKLKFLQSMELQSTL